MYIYKYMYIYLAGVQRRLRRPISFHGVSNPNIGFTQLIVCYDYII